MIFFAPILSFRQGSSFAKTFVGTPQYWAPEVLNVQRGGGSYTQAADYWRPGSNFSAEFQKQTEGKM